VAFSARRPDPVGRLTTFGGPTRVTSLAEAGG